MYYNTKTKTIIAQLPTYHIFEGSSQLDDHPVDNGCTTGEFHLWDEKYHIAEGFLPFEETKPEIENDSYLDAGEVVISEDGMKAIRVWTVIPKTDMQIAAEISSAWDSIRNTRNHLLEQSDWTQLADVPANPEWTVYRQCLRDITVLFDTPDAVIWPDKPS